MCWADRLFILIVFLILALYTLIYSGSGEKDWFGAELTAFAPLFLRVLLPVWIFMRLLDWLTGGPRRRRGVIVVRPIDHY